MPKLKLSYKEELRLMLLQCIEGGMKRYKLKPEDMAAICKMSVRNWYIYRNKPEELPFEKVGLILSKFKLKLIIPQEDIELF